MQIATFARNLAMCASVLVSATLAVGSYPGDLCCRLYEHTNYAGNTEDACFDYNTYGADGQQTVWLNSVNSASSWWCGKNVAYDFCLSSDSSCYDSGAGNARSPKIRFDNQYDSIKFSYYDSAERGAVTAFTDAYCEHTSGRFQVPEAVESTAWFNDEDMRNGIHLYTLFGSVMIPYGYSLEMFNSDGFKDTGSEVIHGEAWSSSEQAMRCINLSELGAGYRNWDDQIRSFAVYRSNYGGVARGTWVAITATESIDFTYQVGMSSSQSVSVVERDYYMMQLEVEAGVEFGAFSGSVKLTGGYESELTTDTTHAMSKDYSTEWSISCSGNVGVDGGVGLWQYVVTTSDGSLSTFTNHTVCRYGDLYNVAPACPWNVCANGDCSACNGNWQA